MSKKQTMRLSLITAAVLVVLLCLVGVFALNVSSEGAHAAIVAEGYTVIVNNAEYTQQSGTLVFNYAGKSSTVIIDNADKLSVSYGSDPVDFTKTYYPAADGQATGAALLAAPAAAGEYLLVLETVPEGDNPAAPIAEIPFNINPRVLVADSWGGVFSEVYKSDSPTPIGTDYLWNLTTTGDDFLEGDEVEIAYRVKDGDYAVWPFNTACDAKTYKVEAYLDGDDAGNYRLVDYIDEMDSANNKYTYNNFNLFPAKITYQFKKNNVVVSPAEDTYTYDGNAYNALTVDVTPYTVDEGEVEASITSWSDGENVIASENVKNVGAYNAPVITLTGEKAGNYYVEDPDDHSDDPQFALTIQKADITGTITQDNWQYGMTVNSWGAKMHFTPSVVAGNTVGETLTWEYQASDDNWYTAIAFPYNLIPGSYTIRVTVSGNDNYNDTTIEGTATVQKATIYAFLDDDDDNGNLIYNGYARAASLVYHLWTEDGSDPVSTNYISQNLTTVTANEGGTNVGNYSVTFALLTGTYEYNNTAIRNADDTADLEYSDLFVLANSASTTRIINYQILPATLTSSMTVYGKVYDKTAFTAPVLKQFEYVADGETSFYKIYGFVNSENLAEFENGDLTYTPTIKYAAKGATENWEAVDENDWTSDVPVNAGEYYIWVVIDGIANYNKIEHHDSFTIQQKVVAYNWSNDDLTYTGLAQKPVATVTNNEAGDEVIITVTGEQTDYSANAYEAEATAVSNANYKLPDGDNTHDFTIGKAELTVTATSQNITYGDEADDLAYTITGFVNDELQANVVTGAPVLTCAYKQYDDVDSYAITVAIGNLAADNYSFTLVNGAVVVGQKAATITVGNVTTDYGTAGDLDVTDSGIIERDLDGSYTIFIFSRNADTSVISADLSGSLATLDVGTYYITIATNNANYAYTIVNKNGTEIAVKKNLGDDPINVEVSTYTINKIDATWTAPTAAENLVYNGNAQNLLVAPTNVVGGTVEYFNGGNWSETMPTGTNAGNYDGLKVRIAPDGNHNAIESSTFDVTIDQYTVVPTFTLDGSAFTADTNITYDGKTYTIAATATVNLTIAQEQVQKTITFGNATATITNAGYTSLTIAIDVYAATGDAQNNYKVTTAVTSAKLTIDPKAIEYKQQYKLGTNNWADYDSYVTYAAAEYTFRVVPTNKIGSDDVYFLLTEEETQTGTDVNIYEYTLTIAGEDKGNYSFTSTDVDFDIFEYNISGKLTVTNVNATYDGQAHTWSIKVLADAGVPGITKDWTIASGTVTNVADSGSYTLEDVWFGTNNYANYEIDEDVVVTYTITKAPSDWSKGVARKTGLIYNGDNQELLTAGTAVGGTAKYRLGDNGEWDTSIPVAKNAGTYYVYYMIVGDANHNDLAADNYEVTIGKKAATITVNNSNRTYGQALSIDVTDSGILDADKAGAYSTVVLAYNAEEKSVSPVMDITTANVGTYYILVGTGDGNYDFTINYVNGTSIDVKPTPEADPIATEVCTYTITNAAAEITADPQGIANLIYTGAAIVLVTDGEATNGHFEYKVDDSAWVIAANAKATNAGTHTIVYRVVGDANYSNLEDESYTFTVTIAKRGVVVTLSEPASYVYSAGAKELTGTYKTWADGAETNVTAAATVSLKDGDDNVNVGTFHYIISIDDGNYTVAEAANASIYAYDNDSEKWIATRAVTAADLANASVAQNGALTYNGGDQTANVTTEGATTIGSNAISYVYSESLTGTYTAAVPAFTTAGEHTVYYTASADNHNDYAGTFTVTIAKKALTIKADNKNVEYGENAPAFTYSFDGFVNIETSVVLENVASISLSCSYVAQPTPGTYTPAGTTCDINVAGSVTADNYAISYEKGTLTVVKRGLTLNINHVEVEYGKDARSYCGYTVAEGGIIDGADVLDNDNVYYYIDSFDAYTVGASGSISFDYNSAPTVVNNNYRIKTVNNGTWTIVKKNVSSGITIEVGELTYNGAEQTIEITVKYGDVVMVEGTDYTVEDNSATAAGNYELCIHGIGNYTGNKTAEWSIAPKPITVVNVNEEHLEVVYGDAEALQATNPAAYIGLKDGFALAEGDTLAGIIEISVDVNGNPVQSLEDVWNVNKYYLHVYDEFDEIKFNSNYTVTVELDEETAYLEIVKRPITIAYTKNEKVQIVFNPGEYIEYELTSLVMENYSLFELIEGTLADGDNDLSGVITIYSEEFEAFVETIEADFSNYFKVLGTYAIDVEDEQGNYEITLVEDANCAFEIVARPLYVVPADGQSKIYGEVDGEIVYIDLLTDNWTYDNEKQEWVCTRETIFKGNAPVAPVAPVAPEKPNIPEQMDAPNPEDYDDEDAFDDAEMAYWIWEDTWEDYYDAVAAYENALEDYETELANYNTELARYEAEIAAYRALIFGLLEGNLGRVEGENAGAYAITIGNLHFKALPAEPVAQPVYDEYVANLPEEPVEPEEPAEPAELEAYAQAYAEWLEQYDAAMAEYNVAVAAYQEYGALVGYKAFYELLLVDNAPAYTIDKKAITIRPDDQGMDYEKAEPDATSFSATAYEVGDEETTAIDLPFGQDVLELVTIAKAAGVNVGEYALTLTLKANAEQNFVITLEQGVFTINQKPIIVKADNATKTYGDQSAFVVKAYIAEEEYDEDNDEVVEIGLTEIAIPDSINDLVIATMTGVNAGTYNIALALSNNALVANYDIELRGGATYTITKKAITLGLYVDGVAVNGNDATVVYDGQAHTFVIKALGAGNEIITIGEVDSLTVVSGVESIVEAGDYAADGVQAKNYVLAQNATFTYAITPKPIDAIVYKIDGVVRNSVEYDGQNHGVIAYATDVEGNLFEIGGGPGKEAGSYTVTVEAGSYNDNYVLAETATFAWSITEKAAVVDPETGAKDYAKEISDKDAASDTGVNVTDLFKKADSEKTDDVESEVTITIKSGEGEEAKTGTIVFDKAAIAQLAGAADVALKINVTSDVEEIAEIVAVKETLKGAEMVINVSLGDVTFESGKATLTFDFDKQAPKGMIGKVYYVDADGNKTDMKATFANGKVTFETTHFSDYIVVFEKAPGLSGGAIAGIVIACVVVAAGIAVGIFFLLKKKKGNGGSATTAGEAAATETAAE